MANQPPTIVWPGRPYPLWSTWDGEGVNFALYSEHAEKVELCIFRSLGVYGPYAPEHAFVDDRQLVERGLRNYCGYNSIGFFALEKADCAPPRPTMPAQSTHCRRVPWSF